MEKEVRAKNKMVRISPRKLRLVADTIRGKNALESLDNLRFLNKRGSLPIFKTLKSAVANAQKNFNLNPDELYVKEVRVDEGVVYKRMRAASKGRGRSILKRTSSIDIKLSVRPKEVLKKVTKKVEEKKEEVKEAKKEVKNTKLTKTTKKVINKKENGTKNKPNRVSNRKK